MTYRIQDSFVLSKMSLHLPVAEHQGEEQPFHVMMYMYKQ